MKCRSHNEQLSVLPFFLFVVVVGLDLVAMTTTGVLLCVVVTASGSSGSDSDELLNTTLVGRFRFSYDHPRKQISLSKGIRTVLINNYNNGITSKN